MPTFLIGCAGAVLWHHHSERFLRFMHSGRAALKTWGLVAVGLAILAAAEFAPHDEMAYAPGLWYVFLCVYGTRPLTIHTQARTDQRSTTKTCIKTRTQQVTDAGLRLHCALLVRVGRGARVPLRRRLCGPRRPFEVAARATHVVPAGATGKGKPFVRSAYVTLRLILIYHDT